MSMPIHIGTYGWDDPAWAARFYPDDLPADWRFCYYSNRLRSVIMPGATWAEADARTLAQWVEDSDREFGIVLELPPTLARAGAIDAALARAAALKGQLCGWLWRPAANEMSALGAAIDRLKALAPVCLDLAGADAPVESIRVAHGAGRCWRPPLEPVPAADGDLLICLTTEGAPRAQRRLLEDISKWQGGHRVAGLYFGGTNAAAQAEQARVLAELMGV